MPGVGHGKKSGEKFDYTNTNDCCSGLIIEPLTGMPLPRHTSLPAAVVRSKAMLARVEDYASGAGPQRQALRPAGTDGAPAAAPAWLPQGTGG